MAGLTLAALTTYHLTSPAHSASSPTPSPIPSPRLSSMETSGLWQMTEQEW